ncbi:MAG: efflux RND transporter periplasmic adaptor subunit [Acidobacteria bacterium]|nr:efflux RND transporter periplasmic adaptor subunit [Acidobacteriota bacterium]
MKSSWIGLTLAGVVACGGCKAASAVSQPPETQQSRSDQAADRNTVRASAEIQKKWGIEVAQAARTTVAGAIALPGVLSLDLQHTAQITSLLDGKVILVDAQVGDEVRQHQALVTVHAPALAQAKTAYLQAGSRLELARREFERAEILLKQEAIDQREHLRRRTEFENASSEFAVAESNLHSYGLEQAAVEQLLRQARRPNNGTAAMDDLAEPYLTLTAPIAGHVVERDVINGQHIEPQKMLLTVSDLSTLWALLDARETDLPLVARGREVRITTSIYPDRVWQGRVDHVGDIVDEKTRTVKVRVIVRNDGRLLKPNMYIQGELPNAVSTRDVLTLPQEAIQTIGGESVVFVREGADRFVARLVETGDRVGARRAMRRGLDGSEMVVIAGAFNLKAELLKSTLAGE